MKAPDSAESVVAVIDIGSNSGRVVVYRGGRDAHLRILASSRGLAPARARPRREGELSAEAEDRCSVWRPFGTSGGRSRRGRGRATVAVATAAMRDAEQRT